MRGLPNKAKIYIRLLATRVNEVLLHLIDMHQMEFMANHFISENEATTRLVMDVAQRTNLPGVTLRLDQEKLMAECTLSIYKHV
ncbi:hypothetical protein G6F61_003785 [Rhizopus arrhizus]|nr:hypothetical protein G6F61_003785 [Rhizopus arrhizus]